MPLCSTIILPNRSLDFAQFTHTCYFFIKGIQIIHLARSAPFVTSCEVVRKLGSFRLTAPAAMLGHLGAISLKLPNFLTTSQDVTKGADQAIRIYL